MDPGPTQGNKKRLPFSNYSPWERRPPLCHLDRSEVEWRDLRSSFPRLFSGHDRSPLCHLDRSAASGEICGPRSLNTVSGTTALPFVISTAAQRSGEICGPRSLNTVPGHDRSPLCHLDRSAAQWRDLRSSCPKHFSGLRPLSPLSSRPERSAVERSAVLVP